MGLPLMFEIDVKNIQKSIKLKLNLDLIQLIRINTCLHFTYFQLLIAEVFTVQVVHSMADAS